MNHVDALQKAALRRQRAENTVEEARRKEQEATNVKFGAIGELTHAKDLD